MKITILGAGRSGLSALRLAQKFEYDVTLVNQGDKSLWAVEGVNCIEQDNIGSQLIEADIIVKSPGIDPRIDLFEGIDPKKIVSEVEWAYRHYKGNAKTIAITGSNGKTTTSTMLAQYLESIGKSVFLGGNIGTPICEFVTSEHDVDYIVLEVSSFQLENIDQFYAAVGVILNISENHMERYDSTYDYAKAKYNLVNHSHQMLVNQSSLFFDKTMDVDTFDQTDKIASPMLLPGDHNRQNAFVVARIVELLGEDKSQLDSFLKQFRGVEHRFEFVGSFSGLKVYNDSKSTNLIALEAALSALNGSDNYLILTGRPRGSEDFSLILKDDRLKKVFSYGEASKVLPDFVDKKDSLEEILNELKGSEGVLVFSPGFPSFDLYKNFEDRGRIFKKTILKILSHPSLKV